MRSVGRAAGRGLRVRGRRGGGGGDGGALREREKEEEEEEERGRARRRLSGAGRCGAERCEAAERGRPGPSCARYGSGRGAPRSLPRARRQEVLESRPSSAAARGLGLSAARPASLPSRGRPVGLRRRRSPSLRPLPRGGVGGVSRGRSPRAG